VNVDPKPRMAVLWDQCRSVTSWPWTAALWVVFAAPLLVAQCMVDNPGGSRVNVNRPRDSDVPAARLSPMATLNDALPDWICFNAGYRARIESYSGGGFRDGSSDSYLLTRFRAGVLIKPIRWFSVYGELQDATAFWKAPPLAPPYQSTWDLRRAYVDFGDLEHSPLSFRAGRQDLNFGDARLVGTSYWRNASRGYDAAMVTINQPQFRLSAFAASPVVPLNNGLSHHQGGNNLHGVYTALKKLVPGSVVEPYVFWRLTPGVKTEAASLSKLDEKTLGVRWAGNKSRLDYNAEAVGQFGSIGGDHIRAWAWVAMAGYTFESARLKPRVFAEASFASGDQNSKDGRHGTFDQLYPNIHGQHGLSDQVAWQNLKETRAGVRISLRRNWLVAGSYSDWWLASASDGFYNASGAIVARDTRGLSGTHIGQEFSAETSYRLDRHLELGAGIGHILPGEFLVNADHKHAYTYPYVMLNYNFF
jgi:hypothetical protein